MIRFETSKISDIETLSSMMKDFYAIDNYPISIEKSKMLLNEFIQNENLGKSYLIYKEEKIAGYFIITYVFSFEYGGRIAFLDELYIKSEFRNQGIGNDAIEFLKTKTNALNINLIYLEIENHNEKAQNLYLKHNFEIHNRKLMKLKT